MPLFDDGERNYTGYRDPQESHFAFLNRSSQPKFEQTRRLLENWFRNYPLAHQVALCTSFRTNRHAQHWGAFFELYCHAFLRQQGFIVEVQQVVEQAVGRSVDFLASSAGVPLFYMERMA